MTPKAYSVVSRPILLLGSAWVDAAGNDKLSADEAEEDPGRSRVLRKRRERAAKILMLPGLAHALGTGPESNINGCGGSGDNCSQRALRSQDASETDADWSWSQFSASPQPKASVPRRSPSRARPASRCRPSPRTQPPGKIPIRLGRAVSDPIHMPAGGAAGARRPSVSREVEPLTRKPSHQSTLARLVPCPLSGSDIEIPALEQRLSWSLTGHHLALLGQCRSVPTIRGLRRILHARPRNRRMKREPMTNLVEPTPLCPGFNAEYVEPPIQGQTTVFSVVKHNCWDGVHWRLLGRCSLEVAGTAFIGGCFVTQAESRHVPGRVIPRRRYAACQKSPVETGGPKAPPRSSWRDAGRKASAGMRQKNRRLEEALGQKIR
ncbi:hypothetical protein MAPG_09067 [Magnaporthiopsis poae ATCC 64411]|uniref:Uncharacterized protein n=1 Tax=Magnaporthiopsis poae (strain ATCC 64411 / 73-15) TaxID=644358 RepID=A0A0C4E8Z4_MAGP6|nr:hypothetical protein MAPG_09067 [Magnaporthiopsis poae ATCC 64411]